MFSRWEDGHDVGPTWVVLGDEATLGRFWEVSTETSHGKKKTPLKRGVLVYRIWLNNLDLVQVLPQMAGKVRMTELAQRLFFQLPDTFSREAEHFAYFLKGS